MTQTAAYGADALEDPVESGSGGWLREVVVHVSMMTVIAALGMALRTSFGLGMVASIVIALTVYWCLLVVHALVRRGQIAADLGQEVEKLAGENAALRRLVGAPMGMGVEREPPRLSGFNGDRPPPRVLDRGRPGEPVRPRAPEPPRGDVPRGDPSRRAGDNVPPREPPVKGKPGPAPAPAASKPPASAVPARPGGPPRGGREEIAPTSKKPPVPTTGPRAPAPPPLPSRPRPQGLAALAVDKPAVKLPAEAPREEAEAEDPRAQDIAIMQSLIKGLADQINGAPAEADTPRAPLAPEPPPVVAEPTLDTTEEQVGALRDMADDMRGSLATPVDEGAAMSRALSVQAELAHAMDDARIDICLDPILGLGDRRARHFEVSVRLRSEDGAILDPRLYASMIAGTGLMPRIEALTFSETIRFAGEFAARGAAADLFSVASGESLRDGGFHAALTDALAPDTRLGARLVMSIAQAEVRAFGPAHWRALAALSEAGLRYALVDVVDLDMDFEALAAQGFEFVRLDASVFLQGLAAPHGMVPADDLCRYLSGLGFTLIVSRIAEERELAKVLGFGALLGQGQLFGGPRPIRRERPAPQSSAA
jgi:cyclic-di-GMP phosphodiesterase TipF (flagellum assembly factor)